MRKANILSIGISLIMIIIIMFGCSNNSNVYYKVTYKVNVRSYGCSRLLVIYKDSNDYEKLFIDKNWSKDVYIRSKDLASLLVTPLASSIILEEGEISFTASIVHDKETVSESNNELVTLASFMPD